MGYLKEQKELERKERKKETLQLGLRTESDTIYKGYRYVVVVQPMGFRCGYVEITDKTHPFYGLNYSDCSLPIARKRGKQPGDDIWEFDKKKTKLPETMVKRNRAQLVCKDSSYCCHTPEAHIAVHGGITFSSTRKGRKLYPAKSDGWWFGFDCGHSSDRSDTSLMNDDYKKLYTDLSDLSPLKVRGKIRSRQYCEKECCGMIDQLIKINRKRA